MMNPTWFSYHRQRIHEKVIRLYELNDLFCIVSYGLLGKYILQFYFSIIFYHVGYSSLWSTHTQV